MLLLYQFPRRKNRRNISEFTFHYASTLSVMQTVGNRHSDSIYIPLCFYFINVSYRTIHAKFKFTFHYASTLSAVSFIASARESIFTFHYASTLSGITIQLFLPYIFIYIPLCFYFIRCVLKPENNWRIYLHSIMLLLYRKDSIVDLMCENNLHSIMLLLYPSRCTIASLVSIFTFHYASTLSKTQFR